MTPEKELMNFIFDLDGTLVDSAAGIHTALEETVRQVYPEIDPDDLDLVIGPPLRAVLTNAFGRLDEREMDKLERVFKDVYDNQGWQSAVLYPGVRETLDALKAGNLSSFIVTNKLMLPTMRVLSNLELMPYFKDVVCPDSVEPGFASKTESLQYLLDKWNLDKEDTVYVGDTEDDLFCTRACGVGFIGAKYGYGAFDGVETEICLIHSFPELLHTGWFQSSLTPEAPSLCRGPIASVDESVGQCSTQSQQKPGI